MVFGILAILSAAALLGLFDEVLQTEAQVIKHKLQEYHVHHQDQLVKLNHSY